ncbi:hypothetical protein [Sinorhizobium meliloti]|uniref:hypothetical protein n=1 Tax=Rhizobium meliloti TaxID=382 RepID=UPI003F16DA8E
MTDTAYKRKANVSITISSNHALRFVDEQAAQMFHFLKIQPDDAEVYSDIRLQDPQSHKVPSACMLLQSLLQSGNARYNDFHGVCRTGNILLKADKRCVGANGAKIVKDLLKRHVACLFGRVQLFQHLVEQLNVTGDAANGSARRSALSPKRDQRAVAIVLVSIAHLLRKVENRRNCCGYGSPTAKRRYPLSETVLVCSWGTPTTAVPSPKGVEKDANAEEIRHSPSCVVATFVVWLFHVALFHRSRAGTLSSGDVSWQGGGCMSCDNDTAVIKADCKRRLGNLLVAVS